MNTEDLQVVLKVAEFRSITAAAENLNMRTATASAAVKRVENILGVELFIRTTRRLRLSSAGERYIPDCEQALLMLDQAKLKTQEDLNIIDGELRIAMSSDLGRNLITPWLDEFMQTYPEVRLRTNISDSNIDFYRDAVDIALRYGSPDDANLYGFKICAVPRVLCAAKSYLDVHGTPQHPRDLSSHNGLFYQLNDILHNTWRFTRDGQEYKIKMSGNRASNDGDIVRRWCVDGKGLAVKSSLDMAEDLLAGNVVPLMAEFKPTPTELWLICPGRQLITPAIRLLRDLFTQKTTALLDQLASCGIFNKKSSDPP